MSNLEVVHGGAIELIREGAKLAITVAQHGRNAETNRLELSGNQAL